MIVYLVLKYSVSNAHASRNHFHCYGNIRKLPEGFGFQFIKKLSDWDAKQMYIHQIEN